MSFDQFSADLLRYSDLGFSLDTSLMDIPSSFRAEARDKITTAFSDMRALESGAVANPDEKRMVGHYWLRTPELAPTEELRIAITKPIEELARFAPRIHEGTIAPPGGGVFETSSRSLKMPTGSGGA